MYFSQSGGNSWADRVKGIPASPKTSEVVKETPEKHELHPVLPSPPVLSPVPSSLTESLDSFKEIIGNFCIYIRAAAWDFQQFDILTSTSLCSLLLSLETPNGVQSEA